MNATSTSIPHPSSSTDDLSRPEHRERALVLGGGGSVGNAWVIGVIAGLCEVGLDVTGADLTIGTSSGSTAAAQLTSTIRPSDLLASILATHQPSIGASGSDRQRTSLGPSSDHLERTNAIIAAAKDATDMRRRIGAAAIEKDPEPDDAVRAKWRNVAAARLPSADWPEQELLIPVVDAESGNPVVFDRRSGVELVDAVAASTSNGFGVPPYEIGGKRYIDGGYRRNENADLALGYGRVLVLSPFGGRSRHPSSWGMDLATQVNELRAGGSTVETIFPDIDTGHMFGANAMNQSLRPGAARAGYDQGIDLAVHLSQLWR